MGRIVGSERGERGVVSEAGGRMDRRQTSEDLARRRKGATGGSGGVERERLIHMKTSEILQLKELTTAEKLLLVEDLWQEIAAEVEAAPLAPHVVHALEESAARYASDPNEGSPWSEVRARVLARRQNA